MNNKTGPQITSLYYKGKVIDTNLDMANTFNEFFTNIGPILARKSLNLKDLMDLKSTFHQEFHIPS